jgi:hypothetical protein
MDFGVSAETDVTIGNRQFTALLNALETHMRRRIADCDLASSGWTFYYVPILMSAEYASRYPARTRCYSKKKVMNCCPQLDHRRYVEGADAIREAVLYEGLLQDGAVLLKRAGFSEDLQAEFEGIIRGRLEALLRDRE